MIAICASFGEEYAAIHSRMKNIVQTDSRPQRSCKGIYHEIPVELILIGVGRKKTEEFATIDWSEFGGILLIGYCGGLSADLKVGDLVSPAKILNEYGDVFDSEPLNLILRAGDAHISGGPLVTVEELVRDESAKARLAKESGAVAVDMEAYFIAKRGKELGIPVVVIKAIADGLKDDLPNFGKVPTGDSVKEGAKRDANAARLWRENMLRARSSLVNACDQVVPGFYHTLNF